MANEFYTLIVVPHAKARFRKFQVSVRLTKWVLGALVFLGLALVGIVVHYTWINVEVAELARLRGENLALAAKARAYEAVSKINFEGAYYRKDISDKALRC